MDFAQGRLGGGLTLDRDAAQLIEPVLRQVVTELQINEPDRLIETDFALTAPVDCDRRRVGRARLESAGQCLDPRSTGQAGQHGREDGEWLVRAVRRYSGTPIPAAVLDHIFKPFSAAHRPSRQGARPGPTFYEIATAHGGTLDVRSTLPGARSRSGCRRGHEGLADAREVAASGIERRRSAPIAGSDRSDPSAACHALQHVAQIGFRVEAVESGGGDEDAMAAARCPPASELQSVLLGLPCGGLR